MMFRLFQYALPGSPDLSDLNAFLESESVLSVTRHVVPSGDGGLLVFVVQTLGSQKGPAGPANGAVGGSPRIDYREVLGEADFEVYNRLRFERRRVAEAEGIPVYSIFTNAQLAAMVRQRQTTASGLGRIAGVGQARIEKYSASFLAILAEAFAAKPEADANTPQQLDRAAAEDPE